MLIFIDTGGRVSGGRFKIFFTQTKSCSCKDKKISNAKLMFWGIENTGGCVKRMGSEGGFKQLKIRLSIYLLF